MSTTTQPTTSTDVGSAAPSGDRFVGGTLLTIAGILVVYQAIARAVIPPLAVFAVLLGLAALLVRRRHARWRLVVAGVVVLLYLVGSVPFFAANLAHPESPVSFLAEAFLLIALVAALIGVAVALRSGNGAMHRPITIGAGALAALAVVVSLVATLGVDSDARQPGDAAIEVVRSVYPAAVEVPLDTDALWVDNQDPFHHTIVIDGTDVREVLPASTAVRMPVDLAAGNYRYWCDVPGHESMEGQLDVR